MVVPGKNGPPGLYGPRCRKIRRAISLARSAARQTENAILIALCDQLLETLTPSSARPPVKR